MTDDRDQRVFWLNGLAGTGKSTIAQSFAQTSFSDGKLGAGFFCSRDFEDRSNIQKIFPTLAFQLACQFPQFREELLPVLRTNPNIERDSLCSQLETLIIGPFKTTRIQTLIIVDALDECKDEEPASAILSVLSRYIDQIPGVKFFITGRPEPRIRSGFRLKPLRPITEVLRLHDVERTSVDGDIKLFFETRLGDIAENRSDFDLTESWPSSYDINILRRKAAGLFIYASTVIKFVASPYHLPSERLALIISLPHSTAHEGKSGIDVLYTQVLEQAFRDLNSDDQEVYSRFKLVVGAVLLVSYPLSRKSLSELFENCGTPSHISNTLRSLHSVLLVPIGEAEPIRTFHKSFPDFLTDPGRCRDERFFIDPLAHHIHILFSCLALMKKKLKRDICNLKESDLVDMEDLPALKETWIGDALEYACRFWTKHLAKIPSDGPHVKQVQESVDEFFTTRLPFWIEVLVLGGNLDSSVYALHDIDQWYLSVSCVWYRSEHTFTSTQTGASCQWTEDSRLLILSNFDEIRHCPANIYSCLQFCPSSCWLHKWYTPDSMGDVRVIRGRPDEWGTCSRIVPFEHCPETLANWKDVVVVGLRSGDIVVLDAITGSHKSLLSGHTGRVSSLSFSQDGTLLISGSFDGNINVWDIQTGGIAKTFQSFNPVGSVSISPDATTIASAWEGGIYVWDIQTKKTSHVLFPGVTLVEFLPTVPGHLMSISAGDLVQQWNTTNGEKIGHQLSGRHLAFSLDGRHFILCGKEALTIRDSSSRAVTTILRFPHQDFSYCCFSLTGEFVAGVAGATIYIWNVTSTNSASHFIGSFAPHNSKISSLLYSSSLISAHGDGMIRFSQIGGGFTGSTAANTEPTTLTASTDITCITLQEEEGFAITVDLAGTVKLWDLSTGHPNTLLQTSETERIVKCARLVKGTLTLAYHDIPPELTTSIYYETFGSWKIFAWDVEAQQILQTAHLYKTADSSNDDFAISEDGTTILSIGERKIQAWSTQTGRERGWRTYESIEGNHSSQATLDHPGHSERLPVRGRNLSNFPLNLLNPSGEHTTEPLRVELFDVFLTGSNAHLTQYDIKVDKKIRTSPSLSRLFRLPKRSTEPIKAQWDGRYLFVAYQAGDVVILDLIHALSR